MGTLQNEINSIWDTLEVKTKEFAGDDRFISVPVSPKDFASNWIKMELFPEQLRVVDATFTKDFKDISTEFNEYIIAFGKGSGKDTIIAFILAYMIHWLLHLRSPQEYLGIIDGDNIDIVNMAFDGDQANSVFFDKFKTMISKTINPATGKNFFTECGMDIDKSVMKDCIKFPKNIRAWSLNSKEGKAEGKNILFAIFDEVGSFRFDKADSLRNHIVSSAKTRFKDKFKVFYISFIWSANDYMCHLLELAESGTLKKCFYSRKATWEVRSVSVGKGDPLYKYAIHKEDFAADYDEDPERASMKYECVVPRLNRNQFIKKKEAILECVGRFEENGEKKYRPSPIVGDPIYTTNILKEEFEPWFKPYSTYELFRLYKMYEANPSDDIKATIAIREEELSGAKYRIHLDMSRGVVDAAGIMLLHSYNVLNTRKVYVDLMLQMRAAKDSPDTMEINQTEALDFVINILVKKMGFPITEVTADGYQSALFFDFCRKAGIPAGEQSLVRTNQPYETMKDFIMRGDVNYYYNPVLIRELSELEYSKDGKIDHPSKSQWRLKEEGIPGGSKELGDCLGAGIFRSVKDDITEPLCAVSDARHRNRPIIDGRRLRGVR